MGILRFLRLTMILQIGIGWARIMLADERPCTLKEEREASAEVAGSRCSV